MKRFFLYFSVLVSVICTVSIIAEGEQKGLENITSLSNSLKEGASAGVEIKNVVLNPGDGKKDVAKYILQLVSAALGPKAIILTTAANLLALFKEATPSDRQVMLQQEIRHLGEIPEKEELHARIAQVETLIVAFQRLVHSPMTEIHNFHRKCDNNPPDETLDYIYIHRHAIKDSAARRYDRLVLLQTMQALGITQLNALKMYEACQAVKAADLPVDEREQYMNGKKLTVEEFKENIKTVMQALYDAEDHIYRNFFVDYAKTEIDNFVAGNSNLSNRDLGDKLNKMLATKYYWGHFAVIVSTNVNSIEADEVRYFTYRNFSHSVQPVQPSSLPIWHVFMSRVGTTDNRKFKSDLTKCISDRMTNQLATSNLSCAGLHSMKQCIKEYRYETIVCVMNKQHLVWTAGSTIVNIGFEKNGVELTILAAR